MTWGTITAAHTVAFTRDEDWIVDPFEPRDKLEDLIEVSRRQGSQIAGPTQR
ncbi:hypothetical protein V8E53_013531 [Lactarius tabidus]